MVNYRIYIVNSAQKEIKKIDFQYVSSLIKKIESLAINPFPLGFKKLVARNGYRIRVGDYRIIYDVNMAEQLITIYKIGHRKDVYDS